MSAPVPEKQADFFSAATAQGKPRRIICVTGPMAAGKNAAADILEEKGFLAIDADKTVHEAVERRHADILAAFGATAAERGVCLETDEGLIDRRALGAIVFSDPELLKKQEALIHPAVDAILNEFIDAHPDRDILLNATVLYKTPVAQRCNAVIFVDAPILLRLKRAKARDFLPAKLIFQRFSSQKHLFAKYKKLNTDIYRVWNIGTRKKLMDKLERVLALL